MNEKAESYKENIKPFKKKHSMVWLMYLPSLLLVSVFLIYPFLDGIRLSLTNWDGFSQTYNYIGLDQYKRLLADPDTWMILRNTLLFGVGSTIFQNIIGLGYALLLNRSIKVSKLPTITRTIVFLPVIISPLIMGYIWYFFFAYNGGAINDLLLFFGFDQLNLLANTNINIWIIVLVNTYQFVGVAMIIYLAGLQGISKEFYDAAQIDGASKFQQFKSITLPLLMPSVTVNIVFNVIGGLKLFDLIIALTGGGPGDSSQSLSTFVYDLYFSRQDAGYAAAQGIFLAAIIFIISVATLLYLRRKETEI